MKKILFFALLYLSLTFIAQGDEVEYMYNIKHKCEDTKDRKTCLKAIKVMLVLGPKYSAGRKSPTYRDLHYMLEKPCFGGSNWKNEACDLMSYYLKKHGDLVRVKRKR